MAVVEMPRAERRQEPEPPVLDVAVPVYNEAGVLESSVRRLRAFLDVSVPWPSMVTVVDNGSTDGTDALAEGLAAELPGVRVRHLSEKGRGGALQAAWMSSEAEVVAYMDVDLSTSLNALLPLVAPLVSGHSDLAIGTRLGQGARVRRGPKRELISRSYNRLLRTVLHAGFSDAQCGFKAVRADVARQLLPRVVDRGWFFDTELLVLAEAKGLRIHEVPVDWVDDPDSRVDVVRTAAADLKGVVRLLRESLRTRFDVRAPDEPWSAFADFARIGVASTMLYLVLFLSWRPATGDYLANAAALSVCTVGNVLAHRFLTFRASGPLRSRRLVVAGATAWASSLALTTAALAVAHRLDAGALWLVVGGVLAASAVAAVGRFTVLCSWTSKGATCEPAAHRVLEERTVA